MDYALDIAKILQQGTESDLDALGYESLLTSLDPARRDPKAYCDIWRDAAWQASSSWLKESCDHRAVWGQFHILPLDPGVELELIEKMTAIQSEVCELIHPERDALLGSVQHHLALMYRATREYAVEAQWHREAFGTYQNGGRTTDANVSRFLESVARAKQTIIDGDELMIEHDVERLLTTRREVMNLQNGTVHPFLLRNAGLDVWFVAVMANIAYPEKTRDENDIRSLPESNHWRQLLEILDLRRMGDASATTVATTRYEKMFPIMSSRSFPNPVLTAALIGAEARAALGEVDAEQRRQGVVAWRGPDGGLPTAIATKWRVGTRLRIDELFCG